MRTDLAGMPKRIREARILRGMNQRHLAEAIGTSQQIISNTEVGRTTPDLFTLCMICDALCVPINWIVYGEGKLK